MDQSRCGCAERENLKVEGKSSEQSETQMKKSLTCFSNVDGCNERSMILCSFELKVLTRKFWNEEWKQKLYIENLLKTSGKY